MHHRGVTFIFGLETCFSNDKDTWIAATDYYMYCYIIVLFPLTVVFQLINFTGL